LKPRRRYSRQARKRYAIRKSRLQAYQESVTRARETNQAERHKEEAAKEVRDFYIRHFGFYSNHLRTPKHNATLHLADLPAWFYYQRPSNLAAHDLTCRMQIMLPLNF